MALLLSTNKPAILLNRFRQLIDEKHIETWTYDPKGDFTHTPDQWRYRAWMRPYVLDDVLAFGIVGRNDETLKVPVYGIYHGRFSEAFMDHCDQLFSIVLSTALIDVRYDLVNVDAQPRLSNQQTLLSAT